MNGPDVIAEFQRRRLAAREATAKSRWLVAVFLVGCATALQDRVPWLPFAICGVSVSVFFYIRLRARATLKCPACGRLAFDTRVEEFEWPPNPRICFRCSTRLR
jgi:hypothetical protein